MEYFAGALVAVICLFFAKYFYQIEKNKNMHVKIIFRQSDVFEATRPTLSMILAQKEIDTQATRHFDSTRIKIAITDDKAYWIKDNSVYEADIVNGLVQESSAKIVDMMALDDVKLKSMMLIVEELTKGLNSDSGSTWDS